MIHLLLIKPDMEPKAVLKLARRYAMTGGFEVQIEDNLSEADLLKIVGTFSSMLDNYPKNDLRWKTSIAYRVLGQIRECRNASNELKQKVAVLMDPA